MRGFEVLMFTGVDSTLTIPVHLNSVCATGTLNIHWRLRDVFKRFSIKRAGKRLLQFSLIYNPEEGVEIK